MIIEHKVKKKRTVNNNTRYTSMRNSKSHQSDRNSDYMNTATWRTNLIQQNRYAKAKDYFGKWLTYKTQSNNRLNNENNEIH